MFLLPLANIVLAEAFLASVSPKIFTIYAFDNVVDGIPAHHLSDIFGEASYGDSPSDFLQNMMDAAGVTDTFIRIAAKASFTTPENYYRLGNLFSIQLHHLSEQAKEFHAKPTGQNRLAFAEAELNLSMLAHIASDLSPKKVIATWQEYQASLPCPPTCLSSDFLESFSIIFKWRQRQQIQHHGIEHLIRDAAFELSNQQYGVISPNIILARLQHDFDITPEILMEMVSPLLDGNPKQKIAFRTLPEDLQQKITKIAADYEVKTAKGMFVTTDLELTVKVKDEVPDWYIRYHDAHGGDFSQALEDKPWQRELEIDHQNVASLPDVAKSSRRTR